MQEFITIQTGSNIGISSDIASFIDCNIPEPLLRCLAWLPHWYHWMSSMLLGNRGGAYCEISQPKGALKENVSFDLCRVLRSVFALHASLCLSPLDLTCLLFLHFVWKVSDHFVSKSQTSRFHGTCHGSTSAEHPKSLVQKQRAVEKRDCTPRHCWESHHTSMTVQQRTSRSALQKLRSTCRHLLHCCIVAPAPFPSARKSNPRKFGYQDLYCKSDFNTILAQSLADTAIVDRTFDSGDFECSLSDEKTFGTSKYEYFGTNGCFWCLTRQNHSNYIMVTYHQKVIS